MIVGNLDVFGAGLRPPEYNTPLIVDADRVFSSQVALQGFQPVARWKSEIFKPRRTIDHDKFSAGGCSQARWESLRDLAVRKDGFRPVPSVTLDRHAPNVS